MRRVVVELGGSMRDGWFYNENGKPTGPVSIDALVAFIRKQPDPHNVLVWNTGHQDWRRAKDVPEIAELIFKPPPIPKPAPNLTESHDAGSTAAAPRRNEQQATAEQTTKDAELDDFMRDRALTHTQQAAGSTPATTPPKTSSESGDRRKTFLIALFIVVCIGGILSDYIYANSADGISYLVGQFIGALLICSLFAIPARKKTHTPAVVLAVAGVVVLYLNWSKLIESTEGKKAITAIRTEKIGPHRLSRQRRKIHQMLCCY
jgi:hypothetical protein